MIQVAIIRPGPIVGGMVHPYFERRQGRQPVTYPHPSLEPILERTLGVLLFQEQILRIAMTAAGFSGGEAEELRRAMGFKRSAERMEALERKLRHGMAERGIHGEAQEQIVHAITSFALYGFPESHAASFALIAYASAYLKAHHPTAFLIALLNAWPMGFYHPASLVKDAQRHGVETRPIDVNHSQLDLHLGRRRSRRPARSRRAAPGALGSQGGRPRRPQAYVWSTSRIADRAQRRSRGSWRRPARAAVCQGLAPPRRRGYRERARPAPVSRRRRPGAPLPPAARRARDSGGDRRPRLSGAQPAPGPLAGGPRGPADRPAAGASPGRRRRRSEPAAALTEMTDYEATLADYAGTGLTTGPHPLTHLRPALARHRVLPAAELPRAAHGARVRTGGAVIVRQRPGTAKGLLFLTLEDETGMAQAIVSPDLLQRHRETIVGTAGLVVEGTRAEARRHAVDQGGPLLAPHRPRRRTEP